MTRFLPILLCFVGLLHNARGVKPNRYCRGTETPDQQQCNVCQRAPREVTLLVRNVLKQPFFEEEVRINCTRYETLFYIMQEAAEINPAFKFTVSYNHAGHPGFFIDAMNNTFSTWEEDMSYWEILDGDLLHTPVGVSSYKPKPLETVTFNLTVYTGHL